MLGVLTVVIIFTSLKDLDRLAAHDAQAHLGLLVSLDRTDALIASVLGASSIARGTSVGNEASLRAADGYLKRIVTARSELLEIAGETPLNGHAAKLIDAVDHWRMHFETFSEAATSDASGAMAKLNAAVANLIALGEDLSQVGRSHSAEIIADHLALTKSKLKHLLMALTFGFAVILVLIFLVGLSLINRAKALPRQFEKMVFEQTPDEANPDHRWSADPVGQLTAELWAVALKLRTRLSENKKIERMAFTDPLTGLPNRRGLLAFLDLLAESHGDADDDSKIGLIHIDLDHFKTINDTMGHDAGDTVLKEATRRMSTAIRDSDLLARLGGDEFLIVSTGIESEADLTIIADRLLEQFATPILYHQKACNVGVSMGMVLGGQRGRVRDPKRLLINADMALFRAKAQGRGQYAIFNSAMADEARLRNERSIALAKALQEEAFHPWFQPMIDLAENQVSGLELLSRWHDEERGILMPGDFLADAEAHSLMEEIGLQVFEHAIAALQVWRMSGAKVPTVHLNLSRTQLLSSSFVDRLSWKLDEANLPPEQFAVEVDEKNCNARGCEVAFANVRRLRDLGLRVVLDNFGAEQAALSILGPLQARMIKCSPKTFDQMLDNQTRPDKVRILAALENAAKTFGILISAKGVETEHQSSLFLEAGINIQQGDHLVRVLDVDDTGRFLRGELADTHCTIRQAS